MPRKVTRKKKQISLDFDQTANCHECTQSPGSPDAKTKSGEAVVLSFSEKVSQKEQAHERRLYDAILSRIKHLPT